MKHTVKYLALVVVALLATACDHKELLTECSSTQHLNVVFDWRNAPSASPESMALYLFPKDGGQPLRYVFQNSTGGEIAVPYGEYTALCMNNDNTDWAELKDIEDIETFEIHSAQVSGISLTDLRIGDGADLSESEDSLLVASADLLWTDAGENISLAATDTGTKTLTLYPAESGCRYTIDIYDVENADALTARDLFTTFSGLAGGWHPGVAHPSEENVTMPLTMHVSDDGTKIHGEFVNFGQCPDIIYKNELTLHCFLADGSAQAYRFDVTDQAHNASDPRNVHIVLHGLPIPHLITGGGGLKPVVDDWLVEHIDLQMPKGL